MLPKMIKLSPMESKNRFENSDLVHEAIASGPLLLFSCIHMNLTNRYGIVVKLRSGLSSNSYGVS